MATLRQSTTNTSNTSLWRGDLAAQRNYGMSFTAASTYVLRIIKVRASRYPTNVNPGGSFFCYLASNNAGVPGMTPETPESALATSSSINGADLTGTLALYSFNLDPGYTVVSGTAYWICFLNSSYTIAGCPTFGWSVTGAGPYNWKQYPVNNWQNSILEGVTVGHELWGDNPRRNYSPFPFPRLS